MTDSTKPLYFHLKRAYYIQLDDKFQTLVFDAKPSDLDNERILSKRQLHDCIRAERKCHYLNGKINIVDEARAYAEVIRQNPHLTKTQITEEW